MMDSSDVSDKDSLVLIECHPSMRRSTVKDIDLNDMYNSYFQS